MANNYTYIDRDVDLTYVTLKTLLASPSLDASTQYQLLVAAAITGHFVSFLTFADSFSQTDTKTVSVGKRFLDSTGQADTKTISVGKARSDSSTPTDTKTVNFGKTSSDSSTPTDTKAISFGKAQADSVTESDLVSKNFSKSLSHVVYPYDDLNSTVIGDSENMQFTKVISNAVAPTDTFTRVVGFIRSYSDSTTLTDSKANSFGKILNDTTTTSDSGTLFSQGYCDITYFAEDYVGYSRTF